MRVCLITYDVPHKKTADVFLGLHLRNEFEIEFLLAPFTMRPERDVLLSHRPAQFEGASARSIAQRYDLRVHEYEDRAEALTADWLVVCGANILEANFANSGKIINVHAGLIPLVRGLDSFKWAIHQMKPLGNTLHIINEEADSGTVLHQVETPVFPEDDIHSLADRHYKTEIWLLTNFDAFLASGEIMELETGKPTMRMPREAEQAMLDRFDAYKERFVG